ncbi:MAG: glycosyltransferase family 2 protein [Planctomycetaceae bacterium]|jgi:glycosyltransferase involved in cell wall biosynthesis|nr:glycosyltransferase family 2 protein [Planctomycetaceae bacterium]
MSISIGIPIYNTAKFLPDAIRSVFAQTYQDWELILVDDGSTDRSLEIALSIDDPRVRVIAGKQNRRLAYRLNQLIRESKFDMIARMDADDIMFPNRLETEIQYFTDQKINIVCSAACTINDENKIKAIRNTKGSPNISPFGVALHQHLLLHPTMMVRRQWYLENQYDPEYHVAEDLELFLRSTVNGNLNTSMVQLIHQPLLFYREGKSQNLAKTLLWNRFLHRVVTTYCTPKTFKLFQRIIIRSLWTTRNLTSEFAARFNLLPWFKRLRASSVDNIDLYQRDLQTVLQTRVSGMDEYLVTNSLPYQKFNTTNKYRKSA